MRFLFVMDPPETMLPDKDTSFAFLRAARARGHECWHCLPRDIGLRGSDVVAHARPIAVSDTAPHVELGSPARPLVADLDAVFIRKDPPFDAAYLHLTQLLDLVKEHTFVLNDPQGLRDANEKLFAFAFGDLMPRSLISAHAEDLLEFVREVGGSAVLKPLDGAGGVGVVTISHSDRNARALIDLLTREGRDLALVQEFLPAVHGGDKRVLVLDGEPLGAIRRVPRADDFRANIHVGGSVQATDLTAAERDLVRAMSERLRRHGLWFVGLDLIGERLIEVNVTSPTGIQQLSRFAGRPVEAEVIAWVEQRVAR